MFRNVDQDNVYDTKEFTQKEIDEFIDELSVEQFNKVIDWFGDVPKLVYETEFSCEKCGTKQQQVLEGLQNFSYKLSHETLANYIQTNFGLIQHHNWSLTRT